MNPPCFNAETHTDCPRRHSGCAIDCPDWAAYVAERDKKYDQRAENVQNTFITCKTASDRTKRKLSRIIHDRGRKRKVK